MVNFNSAIFIIAVACGWSGSVWGKPAQHGNAGWQGTVTHVSDGDTLWVRPATGGKAINIRIAGIDAPEICQRHGPEAKAALTARVLHQGVRVHGKNRDSYGRLLARVTWQQTDLGQWMVSGGQAWAHAYRRYPSAYSGQQAQARAARRGLFADAKVEHPREFRKRHGPCPHTAK